MATGTQIYQGRHRRTSAHEHGPARIVVTRPVNAGILNNGTLYVSLTDAATGNILGIDFEPDASKSLRRALRPVAS